MFGRRWEGNTMGCDIHAFVEATDAGGGFRQVADVDIDRDYRLFGIMADVRTREGVTPLFEPRGLPEGVSYGVADEHAEWVADAHSESWLSCIEVMAVVGAYEPDAYPRTLATMSGLAALMTHLDRAGFESRLVFWFDN